MLSIKDLLLRGRIFLCILIVEVATSKAILILFFLLDWNKGPKRFKPSEQTFLEKKRPDNVRWVSRFSIKSDYRWPMIECNFCKLFVIRNSSGGSENWRHSKIIRWATKINPYPIQVMDHSQMQSQWKLKKVNTLPFFGIFLAQKWAEMCLMLEYPYLVGSLNPSHSCKEAAKFSSTQISSTLLQNPRTHSTVLPMLWHLPSVATPTQWNDLVCPFTFISICSYF